MRTNLNVQGLTAEAALTGRREPVCHAAMLEAHAAAERRFDEIRALVDALLKADGDWLPPLAAGALARALIHLRSARWSADGRDRECAGSHHGRGRVRRGCHRRRARADGSGRAGTSATRHRG
jgi:hypothetical protein